MSLLGAESFDIYAFADILDYWQTQNNSSGSIAAGAGRCSTSAYHFNANNGSIDKGMTPFDDGGYCGWAWQESILQNRDMLQVKSASGTIQFFLFARPNGSIAVSRGPSAILGTIVGSTPAGILTSNTYYHIGCQWICAGGTSGAVKVWINNVLLLNLTGINLRTNTLFATSAPWTILSWHGAVGYIDDLYWGDTAGTAPQNAFMGDLRVEGQVAATDIAGGGGTYSNFTPSTGTDHGALLDDAAPDDDTTYVQSATVGHKESVKFPAITLTSGTVFGIQLMPSVTKIDVGDRTISPLVYQGGVKTLATAVGLTQTDFTYKASMFQINPTTSTAWTATTANNMEGGIEVIS